MTVCLQRNPKVYNGQEGDQVTITNPPEGSTFHAVDTGAQYIYHDGGWAEDLRLIYALTKV